VATQNIQLCITILGEQKQEAIVFLPGFLGCHAVWNSDLQALSRRYKLIFIDILGFGCSPKPDIEYSLTDHLFAIRQTLFSLNTEKAHFVGHSMGCLLALAYACHFPASVARVALLSLSVYRSEEEARRIVGSTSLLTRLVALDTQLAQTLCQVMCATRPLWLTVAPLLAPDVPPAVARDALQHTWPSYSGTLRNVVFKSRARDWLQQVQHPALIIQGTHDRIAPVEPVREVIATRPNMQLRVLEAGHRLIFTHSTHIAAEVTHFFGDNSPGCIAAQSSS
jgi:pimeloyl-ACP methyl ester carboxylesterase